MSLTASIREQVRQRAQCACEFCGVTEIDVGGMLTIDHFQPRTKAGSDALDNLIYACIACNQYKQDYGCV
jgi:5-methylcytosine-specific restriction endonuclease McrA